MFERDKRYTLSKTDDYIDEEVQSALWQLLDLRLEMDILCDLIQYFDLYVSKLKGQETQMVIMRQDNPAWGKVYFLKNVEKLIHMKSILIVDAGEYSVMTPYLHDLPDTFDLLLQQTKGGIYGV